HGVEYALAPKYKMTAGNITGHVGALKDQSSLSRGKNDGFYVGALIIVRLVECTDGEKDCFASGQCLRPSMCSLVFLFIYLSDASRLATISRNLKQIASWPRVNQGGVVDPPNPARIVVVICQ